MSDVQSNLNEICSFTSKNQSVSHPGKSKALLFSKHSQASSTDDPALLKLNGVKIDHVRSYRCLGFTLDKHLDYSDHKKDSCRKLNYGLSIIMIVKEYPHDGNLQLLNHITVLLFCISQR